MFLMSISFMPWNWKEMAGSFMPRSSTQMMPASATARAAGMEPTRSTALTMTMSGFFAIMASTSASCLSTFDWPSV